MQYSAGKEIIAGWSAKQNIASSVHFQHSVSPRSWLPHLLKKPASQAPLRTAASPVPILENTSWEGFTCKLYYRRSEQDRGGCTSSPSVSSAPSTMTSGLWPFPRAGCQSQSKHVWVRFSRSAKSDDVLFSMGRMIAIHRTDKWRDLIRQTLDVVPRVCAAGPSVSVAFQRASSPAGSPL